MRAHTLANIRGFASSLHGYLRHSELRHRDTILVPGRGQLRLEVTWPTWQQDADRVHMAAFPKGSVIEYQ